MKLFFMTIVFTNILVASPNINYENSMTIYKSISTQLKNECKSLVRGNNINPIIMKSIQKAFWKAKDPESIVRPINQQSLLSTFHKLDILYCKKALEKYKISKEINDTVLKDLKMEVYFFEDFIEVMEDSSKN